MQTIINNRYQLIDSLGAGGMGTVYRAKDRLTGNTIALKQVLILAPDAPPGSSVPTADEAGAMSEAANMRLALTREFQTLASLRHPHIISVLDYGFDAERQPYFTMNLLEEPLDFLQAAAAQSAPGKVKLLIQMLQALAYLHRRGLIHRDLKPANVLATGDGTLKVLDFGLAIQHEQADEIAGTLRYIAPEVFQGGAITPASDLFAVGVMAYEAFTGAHPFEGDNPSQIVMNTLTQPPDLSRLPEPFADSALTQIIGRLLEKDADQRYPSADAAISAFNRLLGDESTTESREIRESFLQAATFVGREAELQQLIIALKQITSQTPQHCWLIGGESGVGKSRLVEELRVRALVQGVTVLRGQSVEGGGLPYQTWREIVRRLLLATPINDLEASILKALVPDISRLLERNIPDAPPLPAGATDTRLRATILELCQRQQNPLLLIMEDLQWTQESLDLLTELLEIAQDKHLALMIVGTYRDDESPDLPQSIPGAETISLSRFDEADITTLSRSMLGDIADNEDVMQFLQRETEGNAFFMVEVVRALAEEAGRLADVGRATLPAQVFAGGMQRIINRRLEGVPIWGHSLLRLAAVIGRTPELPLLQNALETQAALTLGTHTLDEWLTGCLNAAVLEVQDEKWRFAHDKLREALLGGLTAAQRTDYNRMAAEGIEAVYVDDLLIHAQRLVDHWHYAGDIAKEIHHALEAGWQLRDLLDNEDAERYFQRALTLLPDTASSQRVDALRGLGLCTTGLGRIDEGVGLMEQSIAMAQAINDTARVVRAKHNLQLVVLEMAEYDRAVSLAEDMVEQAHKLVEQQPEHKNLLIQVKESRAFTYMRTGNLSSAITDIDEAELLIDKDKDRYAYMQLCGRRATIYAFTHRADEAVYYGELSLRFAREMNDISSIHTMLGNLGVSYWFNGKPQQAKDYLLEVLDMRLVSKNKWSYANNTNTLGYVETDLGNFAAAREYFKRALKITMKIKAPSLTLDILGGIAQLYIKSDDATEIEYGLEIMGAIQAHPAYNQDIKASIMPIIEAATAKIGAEKADAAQATGQTLDFDFLVETILTFEDATQ